jgi:heterodisulfide reductase subunit A
LYATLAGGIMDECLVIGAGISGCTAGVELAEAGQRVQILEIGSTIGGKVLSYCCKATDDCSKCGVCRAHTQINQALRHPGIRFTAIASIEEVRQRENGIAVTVRPRKPQLDPRLCIRCDACLKACPAHAIQRYRRAELLLYPIDFSLCLLTQGRSCTACRDACPAGAIRAEGGEGLNHLRAAKALIAIGHEPFDAARRVRLGYGRLPNVLTGAEAEEILSRQSTLGSPGESIAFVQCVGSRDPHLGRNYCSSVCCAYALRLARMLRHRDPQAEVTVYYIDLQNVDKTFALLRRELEQKGVRFVRGVPFSIEQAGQRLRLLMEDPRGKTRQAIADRAILSVGLGPAPQAEAVAGLFGLKRDAFGFLSSENERVFVTGTCHEPQGIMESMASARAVVTQMLANGGGA